MARKRKKKKTTSNTKVRNVIKSKLEYIERIWAEDGIVKVQTKDGRTSNLTVREAAIKATQLNSMPVQAHLRSHQLELIETIVNACKKAKSQSLDPFASKKTQGIQNVLEGKTFEGKDPNEIKRDEDTEVQKYLFMFPTVLEDEVRAVVNEQALHITQKEQILNHLHVKRLNEYGQATD